MPKMFKTTVAGIGPFCVEFEDGEIITTRSEARQKLIRAAGTLKHMVKWCIKHDGECLGDHPEILGTARDAIAELESPS